MKGVLLLKIMIILASTAVFSSQAFAKGDITVGKMVFEKHCASCHGVNGDGNAPMSKYIKPAPSDFVSQNYKDSEGKGLIDYMDEELKNIIMFGRKGTTMVEFGSSLKEQDIEDVLEYIRSLHEVR